MSYNQKISLTGTITKSRLVYDTFRSGKQYIDFIFTLLSDKYNVEIDCNMRLFNVNKHNIGEATTFTKNKHHEMVKLNEIKFPYVIVKVEGDFNGFQNWANENRLAVDQVWTTDNDVELIDEKNFINVSMLVSGKDEKNLSLTSCRENKNNLYVELADGVENRAKVGQGYVFKIDLEAGQNVNEPDFFSWEAEYVSGGYKLKATPLGVLPNYKDLTLCEKNVIINSTAETAEKIEKASTSTMDF